MRPRSKSILQPDLLLSLLLLLPAFCWAGTVQGTGPGGPIPAGPFTASGVVTSNIALNATGTVATGNAVTVTLLGLQHDFAGDLHITLSYIDSNGKTVQSADLVNRIGATSANTYGASADFGNGQGNGDNYQFNSDYAGNIWTTAACSDPPACTTPYGDADSIPGVSTDTINHGQYFTSTTAGAQTNLSYAFSGLSISGGTWRLTITDAAAPNVGSFIGWQISVVTAVSTTPLAPTIVSLTPNSGSGASQTFTSVFSDPNGVLNLSAIIVLFNTTINSAHSCYVYYDPGGNTLYLLNDGGTAWSSVTPGSSAQVSNSQCTLSGAGSSYAASGTNATLSLALKFSGTMLENVYLLASDKNGAGTGWVQKGTWGSTVVTHGPPTVVSLTPSSGSGASQTFTSVFADPGGGSSVTAIIVLFNTSLTSTNGCYVYYDPGGNTLYLLNNGGTAWSAVTPGSSAQVSNGQCTLLGTGSSYSVSGNDATLSLALKFSGATAQNVYLLASDNLGNSTGWVQKGAWTP